MGLSITVPVPPSCVTWDKVPTSLCFLSRRGEGYTGVLEESVGLRKNKASREGDLGRLYQDYQPGS